MGKYTIAVSPNARREIQSIHKSGNKQAICKIEQLFEELAEHPMTGTGKPEQLKGFENVWSRRIDKKNRLVYTIKEEVVVVLALSALGHYNDK